LKSKTREYQKGLSGSSPEAYKGLFCNNLRATVAGVIQAMDGQFALSDAFA
jgi:hypothetical protein